MYSTRHILRFFLLCIVTQGRVSKATNLYISRASGNDSWSCVQTKPCRTIWQGVSLALDGDTIYLDGTNTDQDPYSCHSTQHSGVYINKSLALVGTGPMLPQIRCSEGTRLTFDGSVNTHQMNVTFSGLLVSESFVFFQDTSANIYGCKFVGSKQGVEFVIKRNIVSDFLITNSVFERNEECISVFVNSTKIESPIININFSLKNSSMFNNTIVDGGNHTSFTESSDNNQTVNCFISMESVTFEGNRFNSRGLVFVQFKSGNLGLQMQEVKSSDNWPSTSNDVLKDLQGDSELVLNSTYVDIFINASSFTSQNARELCVTASNTSIQIYNSRFSDHRVVGSGGALSIKGFYECRLFISKSSFLNTTAILNLTGTDGGGGIYAKCTKVRFALKNSIFEGNSALKGRGGALHLCVSSSMLYCYPRAREKRDLDLELEIANVSFSNCNADTGGSLSVRNVKENLVGGVSDIRNSHFIFNLSLSGRGDGRGIKSPMVDECQEMYSTISVMIKGSTFKNNNAERNGSAIYVVLRNQSVQSNVVLEKVTIESNSVSGGGSIMVGFTWSLKILSCTFAKNLGGAIHILSVNTLEIIDSFFVNNLATSTWDIVGALSVLNWATCDQVTIKDTKFIGNFGGTYGGAVVLVCDCKTQIQNSSFCDNFAKTSGDHVFVKGTRSLLIQDSVFKLNMNNLQLSSAMDYNGRSSVIEVINVQTLVLSNTTVETRGYIRDKIMMIVNVGKLVSLGNDSFPTKFVCPVGSKMNIECLPGIHVGDQICTAFVDKEVTYIQFKCSSCEGNSYSLERGQAKGTQLVSPTQCHPCPFGANCTKNIVAKRNFWGFREHRNQPLLRFTMCPVGYCSQPTEEDFPEFNNCQGYRADQLCGTCKANYAESLYSTQCIPSHWCNDHWFWPVALIYVSLLALYLTFRPPLVLWIKRQILWFKENERVEQEVYFDKGYLKILFYFYQAANLFLITGSSQFLIKDKIVEPIVGIFNFKSSSLGVSVCPFPGLTPVTKKFFLTSHIVCTWLIICTLYGVLCGVQRLRGKGKPSPGPYVGGILQTTLLGYTMLASTSLNLLRCVDISGKRRLFFDGHIVCFQWWQYLMMGIACGYVVPFVFVLLWGSIKFYDGTLSVRELLSACFLPLPFLIYWSYVFLHDKIKGAVTENAPPGSDSRRYLEMVLYDSFKRPEEGSRLCLCWESVMIGRRLILVTLRSFVSDPFSRIMIMSLVSVLFLIHHTLTLPFRDGIANIIETISLAFIVVLGSVNVYFASFVSLGVLIDNAYFGYSWFVLQVVELVILCLVPACFFLFVVLAVVSLLCRVIVVGFCCPFKFLSSLCPWTNQTEERRPLMAVAS